MNKNNKNKEDINKICTDLLENVSNSLENSKNNSYKKHLYQIKILKQILIQLGTEVVIDDNIPSIRLIKDECMFQVVSDNVHKFIKEHSIEDIENLLYSEDILSELNIDKDVHTKLFCVYNKYGEPISMHKNYSFYGDIYYDEGKVIDKTIKKLYKQAQISNIMKHYKVTIPDGLDMYGEPKYINGELCYTTDGYVKANGAVLPPSHGFFGELKNYFYKGTQVFAEHIPYKNTNYTISVEDIENMSDQTYAQLVNHWGGIF